MKTLEKLLKHLPSTRYTQRVILAGILSLGQMTAGCMLDRSVIIAPPRDSAAVDGGEGDSGEIMDADIDASFDSSTIDTGTVDAPVIADVGTDTADAVTPTDTGIDTNFPARERCGSGLLLSYPFMTLGVSTGTAIQAELAVADRMPDPGVVTGIAWGDSPTIDMVTFDAALPSRAIATHTYTRTGPVTVTWFVNETECGMQTFNVVNNICTGFSVSSPTRVGDSVTLTLINSRASGSTMYSWGNLPAVPNSATRTGMNSLTFTVQNPPGPGTYRLTGRITESSGQFFDCPGTTLIVP